ncbi:MAG: hypothetical protein O3B86_11240 [Planctomycetota bacterium]|nr:hypothetical protein [Planctomycetota bacterium]
MRTIVLLTSLATLTGCQHSQQCGSARHSSWLFSTCRIRPAATRSDEISNCPSCDVGKACQQVKSSCQNACESPCSLRCKRLGIGWKELRIPVPKLKDRQHTCSTQSTCNPDASCNSKACCNPPTAGCCRESGSTESTSTGFVALPPQPNPSIQQFPVPQQPQPAKWNAATTYTAPGLAQRTQVLETQVNEIHRMLQQRQATNVPHSGFDGPTGFDNSFRVPASRQDVIILPPPAWRTMDGVPPIPNSAIEQTGAYRSARSTYYTARNPEFWPHSPQNIQRGSLR